MLSIRKVGKVMLFPFDDMFDFNNDGELDSFERAAEYAWMEDMEREDAFNFMDDDDLDDDF